MHHARRPFRFGLVSAALLALLLPPAVAAADAETGPGDDLDVTLILRGALPQGDGEVPEDPPSLVLDMRRENGRWLRVWGLAANFNKGQHVGRVTESTWGADEATLSLRMHVEGDPWVPGGLATFDVTLKRGEDGAWAGQWAGAFRGRELAGAASAELRHPPAVDPGVRPPIEPGEHPRLLFRKADLPALRERAETPFGQAAIAKMDSAPGLALRYQLTGDAEFAEQAKALVAEHIKDYDSGTKVVRARVWGWRLEQVALAYDMCYDAWDEGFKAEVVEYLVRGANRVFEQRGMLHKEINWHIAADYPGPIMYGAALGGLALWGEPGPAPAKPIAPRAVEDDEPTIAAAEGFKPADGVPVVRFRSDTMPGDWLYVAGFPNRNNEASLEPLGGPAEAAPKPGDELSFGGVSETWRPLGGKGIEDSKFTGGRLKIELAEATGRRYHTTAYFYTVLENDKPRWVRVDRGHGGAAVFLSGQRVRDGEVVRLEKGLHPWLVRVTSGETSAWGKMFAEPRLIEVPDKDAGQVLEQVRARYADAVADWAFEAALWEHSGRADPRYTRIFEQGRRLMAQYARTAIGAGGFVGGTPISLEGPHKYALCYRNVFARPLTAEPDWELYLPARLFLHRYTADGPSAQEVAGNGAPGFKTSIYIEGKIDIANHLFPPLLPLVPDELRPAVQWMWYRQNGIEGDEPDPAKLLTSGGRPYPLPGNLSLPVYALLYTPLDARPQHPKDVMPNTWAAPGGGFYGFRSGWQMDDEFIAQVYAHPVRGGKAGTLRVVGLGHAWSHGFKVPPPERFAENVVILPEDATNETAYGHVTHATAEEDGSGSVTIDLADVYAGQHDDKGPLYERYLDLRRDSAFKDLGITGSRSVAVDYSGKAGVPCVLAIADTIEGGGPRVWSWQLDSFREGADKGERLKGKSILRWRGKDYAYRPGGTLITETQPAEDDAVEVFDDGFAIRKGDAVLRATFITPGEPKVALTQRTRYVQGFKGTVSRTVSRAVTVEADAGGFFVVITIGRGDPPAVTAEGAGGAAVARVGGVTVRRDGTRVVIAD